MDDLDKILALGLIFIGIIGIIIGLGCYGLAIDPNEEEVDDEKSSSSDPSMYVCCGTGSIIVSILFIALGWKKLNKEREVDYYPIQPQYQSPPYSAPPPTSYQYAPPPVKSYRYSEYQYNEERPVIIQRIGKYIAGDEIEIRDSVVQRSRLGGGYSEDEEIEFEDEYFELEDEENVLHEYKKILENVWEDGKITEYEYKLLKTMRKHENISMADHMRIEKEVLKERRKKGEKKCPNCGDKLEYIKKYDSWYCYNCEVYIY